MHAKTIGCFLLCALCAAAFAQGPGRTGGFDRQGFRGRGGFGSERIVTGAPYSAVEVRQFQERLADGNLITRNSQTALYRDSQGRTRTEVTVTPPASSGKQPYTLITISDPVAGQMHLLDSSAMTSRTTRIRKANPGAGNGAAPPASTTTPTTRTGRNGASINRETLGSQAKSGVLATGTRETQVVPAGRIGNTQPITVVRETWYSADLKRPVKVTVTDPQRGNSDTELTNLVAGEPSSFLFTVPPGYTEKTGRPGRGGPRQGHPATQQ